MNLLAIDTKGNLTFYLSTMDKELLKPGLIFKDLQRYNQSEQDFLNNVKYKEREFFDVDDILGRDLVILPNDTKFTSNKPFGVYKSYAHASSIMKDQFNEKGSNAKYGISLKDNLFNLYIENV